MRCQSDTLDCAGLTGFVDDLQARVEIPVIDPVEAGCRMLQTVCVSGLQTSQIGLFGKPALQRMNRLERLFSEEMVKVLNKPR